MSKYLVILFFCLGYSASAQYYQDGVRRGGASRTMNPQMTTNQKKAKQPDREEMIELSVQRLKQDLNLDSFQAAVIQQLIEENQVEQQKILAEDIPDESKVEKILAIRAKMDSKIKEILSPEQIEKFAQLGKKKKKK